jgi:hypothetical protein
VFINWRLADSDYHYIAHENLIVNYGPRPVGDKREQANQPTSHSRSGR